MSTSRISTRFASITPSATLAVDAKAKALKAAGRPVIGFGAGEPDFATPDYIVEAAVEAARNPAMHRYTPAAGVVAMGMEKISFFWYAKNILWMALLGFVLGYLTLVAFEAMHMFG